MKNLLLIVPLIAASLGLSSCCSLFGRPSFGSTVEETKQVRACGYDTVRETVVVDAKAGLTEVRETKVPRYKTVTKKTWVACPKCVRYYCPKKDCCGSTSDSILKMATTQNSGSPSIGLIPSMKPIKID